MYHFTADHPPEPVRLSFRALIPGHVRQYLKDFQIDAIRFMHTYLAKGEFCVFNDESGLGKQAAVAVLLAAACTSKKCLIVVQNDDRYVNGWEFHFNVLTNLNVMVVKDANDSTDTPHNIYVAKWSTLRTIDDLSKFKFDFIILDNRGQMLNNSFCTSMLIKHYERKINILISSVDITSDLKLLHNVLRLGGRLDSQYTSFKIFEEKFKLPDAKELAYKKVDLEDYFCKRERLADYCKKFRLRRYCHQYEALLPMVKEDRYKINMDLWREKQNMTNSENSSVEFVNNNQRNDEHVKDTQELFEEYCRQRKKQHRLFREEQEKLLQQKELEELKKVQSANEIIYNVDDEVASITATPPLVVDKPPPPTRNNSDDHVLMSPLLVVSDSEDIEDQPQICNDPIDDIEIVDLASEDKDEEPNEQTNEHVTKDKEDNDEEPNEQTNEHVSKDKEDTNNKKDKKDKQKVKKRKYRLELYNLSNSEHNFIMDKLNLEQTSKRQTRHAKEECRKPTKRLNDRLQEKDIINNNKNKSISNPKTPKSAKIKQEKDKELVQTLATSLDNNSTKRKSPLKTNKTPENSTPQHRSVETSTKKTRDSGKSTVQTSKTNNCVQDTTPKNSKSVKVDNSKLSTDQCTTTTTTEEKTQNNTTTTPLTSRKKRSIQKPTTTTKTKPSISATTPTHVSIDNIKQEPLEEETPRSKNKNTRDHKVNSEGSRSKRVHEITPPGVHHKQTRSMQRLTRSAGGGCKYLTKNLSLQLEKVTKHSKKKCSDKKENKTATATIIVNDAKTTKTTTKGAEVKNTQTSIISHKSTQDYESIQCAQRLSGDVEVFEGNNDKTSGSKFLVPPTPPIVRNSQIPSSLTSSSGFFAESEVIFVPPSNTVTNTATNTTKKRDNIILLSSSDNENSTSQSSSTSRRTRALKPKRVQCSANSESIKASTFSELLAQQNTRNCAKSPDLFSNCSDLAQLPCSQPNTLNNEEPNIPFEGFKIFGSEVKQLQQHYALAKNNTNKLNVNAKLLNRDRSCLDILEKMFEPTTAAKNQKSIEKDNNPNLNTPTKRSQRGGTNRQQKTQAPILPSHPIDAITEAQTQQQQQKLKRSTTISSTGVDEDEIFEITNNGTFGSVMRLHSNGDISPVQQTQKANATQHNKITNYLIGSLIQNGNGSQEDNINNSGGGGAGGAGGVVNNNQMEAGTPSKKQLSNTQNQNVRKSPKGKCSSTQVTKLTKWFTKPSETTSVGPTTKKTPTKKSSSPIKSVQPQPQQEVDLTLSSSSAVSTPPPGKRALKRRRLDLAFNK